MTDSLSVKTEYEIGLATPDEFPILEPPAPDKSVLVRYLMSGARRILKPGKETDYESLSTAIHDARRHLAAAQFLLHDHPSSHPSFTNSIPDWPHYEKPKNQAAFHVWAQAMFLRVFRIERMIEGPMVPIDTIVVKGLMVYAVKNGNTRFYGAWTELGDIFVGWMRIQPHISGIESDYAIGEVFGRPVFVGITLDLSGHDAIDKFVLALKEAAWDLGLAGG